MTLTKCILRDKKLFVFDMDGTVYLGNRVFPFAVHFIKTLRENGKKVLFFTNNSSHSSEFYLEKLQRMGFEPRKEEMMTSGDVTAEFLLRHRQGKSVYLLGTPDLTTDFEKKGIVLLDGTEEKCDVVVTGFDTTLTYEKLSRACRFIRGGAEYFATHPDFNCPTETGFIPDSGAIAAFITASTGVSPTYFGKPCPKTLEMIVEATGIKKEDLVFFGDRLYTDIAIGKQGGAAAVLVLTGEATMQDAERAEEKDRPDMIFPSLREVEEAVRRRIKRVCHRVLPGCPVSDKRTTFSP
ncbi:MAG: HAD-IIA family hydrolase [Clostridia bacterium]|nr:HAD-IIA family hydrolase [Clostridia bacterium]